MDFDVAEAPMVSCINTFNEISLLELDRFHLVSESPKAENTSKKVAKRKGKAHKNEGEMDKSKDIDKSTKMADNVQVVSQICVLCFLRIFHLYAVPPFLILSARPN